MAALVKITLDDLRVRQALQTTLGRARDLRPALRAIGQAGVAQTRKRFISKRAPDGSTWKKTAKPSGETMIDKGLLLRSISARAPEADSVSWGSNRIYAAQRQFGGEIRPVRAKALRFRIGGNGEWISVGKITQPARPYLGVNADDQAEFAAILLRHLGEPLADGGGA
ncbi:phage virion morphogenesis protein [Phenylobacterium sp.]|uniref:phage virion morphogenesis protein n=1 Tax=Phenylobacterium sp. TaxID=1871053 RepID=UPI00391BFC26